MLLVILTLIGLWFGLDTAKEPRRFISVLGMLVYVGISYAFSVHRKKVSRNLSNNCACAYVMENYVGTAIHVGGAGRNTMVMVGVTLVKARLQIL